MSERRFLRATMIALAATVTTSLAYADGAAVKVEADELFDQARALMRMGRYAEACPKLSASIARDPGIGAMLWLGECDERAGHVAMAWHDFAAAERLATSRQDPRAEVARTRKTDLDPAVARVDIDIEPPPPDGTTVLIACDGIEASADAWHDGAVDPGPHSFVVRRNDGAVWTASVRLVAGTMTTLHPVFGHDADEHPHAAVAEAAPVKVAPSPPSAAPSSANVDGHSSAAVFRGVGIGAIAAGVIGVGAGLYLGQEARTVYNDATTYGHCNASNQCDADGARDRAHASALARDATIFTVAGGAALAGGVVLAVVPWGGGVRVAPTAGKNVVGVQAGGSF